MSVRPCIRASVRVIFFKRGLSKELLQRGSLRESSRESSRGSKQAGKQVGKQADKQAGKQAGKQASRQASRQAGKQACKQEGKQAITRKAFSRSHALEGLVLSYQEALRKIL